MSAAKRTFAPASTLRGGRERLSDDPDHLIREAVTLLFDSALKSANVVGRRSITRAEDAAASAARAGAAAARRLRKAGHLITKGGRP